MDLETSLVRTLEPMLGMGVNLATIQETVARIQYESTSRLVTVVWKDGAELKYELPIAVWPGVRSEADGAKKGTIPRISRLMALAIKFDDQIKQGLVRHQRELADAGQISRARMTQIMRLTELAPDIQEELLFLPKTLAGSDRITEKALRRITRSIDWDSQRKQFRSL